MVFSDRSDAGRRLAVELEPYRAQEPIVLALPRGGVVVGFEVARALDAPLDVLVARKIGTPGHPEFAIGAVARGVTVLNHALVRYLDVPHAYVARAIADATAAVEWRAELYRGGRPAADVAGKTVILVDDGLATGATAQAAIESLRRSRVRRIILAVPVGAPEAIAELGPKVDALVCLQSPPDFGAVGLWYRRFDQTSDAEVITCLGMARSAPAVALRD